VKPANFLITRHGHLKMTDFGIAKLLDGDVGLTNTGMVIGTAQYMSPEQIGAKEVTGRSDQFSLAVIAYEMLTGRRPFQGDSWPSMMHAIIANEPPPLSQYQKDLGDDVTVALSKGLAKDPQNRYPTCKAFAQTLEVSILGSASDRAPSSWQGTVVPSPGKGEPETQEMRAAPSPTRTETRGSKGPASPAKATVSSATPPTSTREVAPPGPPVTAPTRSWAVPIVTGVVIFLGLGAWVGLRTFHSRSMPAAAVTGAPAAGSKSPASTSGPPLASSSVPPAVTGVPPAGPESSPAVTAGPPSASSSAPPATAPLAPVPRVPGATSKGPAKQVARKSTGTEPARVAGAPSLPLTTTPSPMPPPAITTQASPQPVVVSTPPVSSAPVAPPAAAPKRTEVDRTAEDARRAADEQAKRLKDEEARAAAEEKARSVRAAELQAVSRALSDYQRAYEHKDPAALQAIWPSLSKTSLDAIRNSFHDASEVSVDLRPVGDPEISGVIATVVCDRTVHQIIMKRPMQASDRVRIVLNRRGAGWVITSIDRVSQ
jgi:serine/threonine protein kinase